MSDFGFNSMVNVLLPLGLQRGLNVNLLLEGFNFLGNLEVLLRAMHLQICICHVKQARFAPIVLSFLSFVLKRLIIINLNVFVLFDAISEIYTCTESHLSCLVISLKTLLEIDPFI